MNLGYLIVATVFNYLLRSTPHTPKEASSPSRTILYICATLFQPIISVELHFIQKNRTLHASSHPCKALRPVNVTHLFSDPLYRPPRTSHFFELRFSRHSLSKFILLYSSPHVVLISSQCQGGDVCKTHDTSRNRTGDLEVTTWMLFHLSYPPPLTIQK